MIIASLGAVRDDRTDIASEMLDCPATGTARCSSCRQKPIRVVRTGRACLRHFCACDTSPTAQLQFSAPIDVTLLIVVHVHA